MHPVSPTRLPAPWPRRALFCSALPCFILLVAACSDDDGTGPDGSIADGSIVADGPAPADSADEGSTADQLPLPDLDLGDDLGLVILPGTQACTMFSPQSSYQGEGAFDEYKIQGRISFKAQTVRLFRDQESFDADLVETLELGPQRTVAPPQGPGSITRTLEGTAADGKYHFTFEQTYSFEGQPYHLSYELVFPVSGGVPEQQVIVMDEAHISSPNDFLFTGTLGDAPNETIRSYSSCIYTEFAKKTYTVSVQGGDLLVLEQAIYTGGGGNAFICKICNAALIKATVTVDGQTRVVTDHFRMTYTAGQHNWNQQFMAVFDSPVGSVHGVYLQETTDFPMKPSEVHYLDAALNKASSKPVQSYTSN